MTSFIGDLKQKKYFYEQQGFKVSMLRIVVSDGTFANFLYRVTQILVTYRLSPLALITHKLNVFFNGCVIGAGCTFQSGLVLLHPVGVVINSKVHGGKNVAIESGVVIGDEKGFAPTLGDNVFIGSGAKIIGNIRIGNDVKIGANAVVTKDVPNNVTVVGIPAKIIKRGDQ